MEFLTELMRDKPSVELITPIARFDKKDSLDTYKFKIRCQWIMIEINDASQIV